MKVGRLSYEILRQKADWLMELFFKFHSQPKITVIDYSLAFYLGRAHLLPVTHGLHFPEPGLVK